MLCPFQNVKGNFPLTSHGVRRVVARDFLVTKSSCPTIFRIKISKHPMVYGVKESHRPPALINFAPTLIAYIVPSDHIPLFIHLFRSKQPPRPHSTHCSHRSRAKCEFERNRYATPSKIPTNGTSALCISSYH